jgi:hypothetical protein
MEHGILSMRKPKGRKLTFMCAVSSSVSGVDCINPEEPLGKMVYVWTTDGEQRSYMLVDPMAFNRRIGS